MAEQRAEFEAWAKQAGWPHYAVNADGTHFCSSSSWEPWQAATQRQQERIAELQAQVQALSLDAGRLDWIAMHGSFGVDSVTGLPGGNGQKRKAATRAAIDAAIARATHKEQT